jgi:hypothetical protein
MESKAQYFPHGVRFESISLRGADVRDSFEALQDSEQSVGQLRDTECQKSVRSHIILYYLTLATFSGNADRMRGKLGA